MDRAGVVGAELGLGLEVRAAGAVPALVEALVDVPVVVDALHDLLDARLVARVGGADEEVVGGVDARHQVLEAARVAVGELARGDPLALGRLGDRLPVLVSAGEEEDLLPALAHVAGEDVGADRRVRVPEVRGGVDVVDRRRDVEGHRASDASGGCQAHPVLGAVAAGDSSRRPLRACPRTGGAAGTVVDRAGRRTNPEGNTEVFPRVRVAIRRSVHGRHPVVPTSWTGPYPTARSEEERAVRGRMGASSACGGDARAADGRDRRWSRWRPGDRRGRAARVGLSSWRGVGQ